MDHISKQVYSLIDRFRSIYDFRRWLHVDFALYRLNGAVCSAKQTKDVLILVLLVKRGHVLAFYRPNFRLQNKRVLEIELNEQELLPFFIDFYLGIPDTDSRHPRFPLLPFSASQKL